MKQRRTAGVPFAFASRVATALLLAACFAFATRAGAQAPPPPPVPNPNATPLPSAPPLPSLPPLPATAAPTPTPSPVPKGKHKGAAASPAPAGASPTPTPTSPAFATLDGTWEVQLQYMDRTVYSYLDLKQSASGDLSGRWRRDGKMYPLEGSYDGRNFKMVVKGPDGDYNLTGFVEAASDMIGLVDDGKGKDPIPFTAEHRAAQPHGLLRRGDTVPAGPPAGSGGGPGGAPGGHP